MSELGPLGAARYGGLAVTGADEVLRPPEDGLPYLRLDAAERCTTAPGGVLVDGSTVAAVSDDAEADLRIDASGCAVIPGFVDCHTHLPFVGWRAEEYARKLAGATYEEIARDGGGIAASARSQAVASDEQILVQSTGLAAEMLEWGTTAFECKSGYGLSTAEEGRALRLAVDLHERVPQLTTSTALLAHALPAGVTEGAWLDEVEEELVGMLEQSRCTALYIYVESIAFSNDALLRFGELARTHGLDLRCHIEQFGLNGSVPVALAAGARSVDHLSCLNDAGVAPLADAGAIGVLATDANPGTSPIVAMPIIIGLALRHYRWSIREALVAATLNGAWTMRLSSLIGSIEVGKRADLVVLDGPIEQLPYRFGHNPVLATIVAGQVAYLRRDARERCRL